MPPHLIGPVGNPLPPTRNELKLREEIDRLRAELDECRNACANWEAVARVHQDEAVRARQMDPELDAARQVIAFTRDALPQIWRGDTRAQGRAVLAAYDKTLEELPE